MVQFLKDRNTNGMKTATTVEEQLHKMQERGLIINDLSKAREILSDIGYFRLGFYCFPFEKNYPEKHDRTHLFMENVSFEDVVKLYYFDTDLRYLLSRYIDLLFLTSFPINTRSRRRGLSIKMWSHPAMRKNFPRECTRRVSKRVQLSSKSITEST